MVVCTPIHRNFATESGRNGTIGIRGDTNHKTRPRTQVGGGLDFTTLGPLKGQERKGATLVQKMAVRLCERKESFFPQARKSTTAASSYSIRHHTAVVNTNGPKNVFYLSKAFQLVLRFGQPPLQLCRPGCLFSQLAARLGQERVENRRGVV